MRGLYFLAVFFVRSIVFTPEIGNSGTADAESDIDSLLHENIFHSTNPRRKRRTVQYQNSYRLDPNKRPTSGELKTLLAKVVKDIPGTFNVEDYDDCVAVRIVYFLYQYNQIMCIIPGGAQYNIPI